ncbi:GAF domain-containing sensor histidine kinase [Mucilaginibacter flavus]|uniref:GAF domain-containing sensor histidine kinase n=1 Tax=Mucilaginibacter flavus TaxID=931504 RepID=UPI0025B4FF4B|nr:GAF domain-containing sensor histidine kinase [Mucilaginibacter flavus]MDN3583383.1 GAF domain-containing sensor histidine kinase [Mucilaginibacter flavus]
MTPATLPENEYSRLQDLYGTGLLDTPNENEFDDIVKLASALCDMPISLISLVDANRQWFKARVGLDATETNRDVSFCSHAILHDQIFEIPDALLDIRFSDNPLVVSGPAIRFYAGVPLVTNTGSRLGTLCVIDRTPRYLTDEQRFALKVLAANVIKVAELRIKNKQLQYLTETQKRIISILAHDVRNPLASIKSIIDFKTRDILDADEANEMMAIVSDQMDSTLAMVENVVKWGELQIKFSRFKYDDFNFNELAERVLASELLKAKTKNNILINSAAPGTVIHSDKQALEFILRNLISNANKYTHNGSITLSIQQFDHSSVIEVIDTGVGMSAEKAQSLLNNHDNTSTPGTDNETGNGMGLLLVREFIDRLNGKISIESAEGIGTKFKIVL